MSAIYTLPAPGGTPRRVTANAPSYWHGWSPDGRTLAYCAERVGEFDVHTIPVKGGDETPLTTAPGLDDGPDYSPDGQWVAFLSYDSDVKGHPPNKDVMLRMMPAGGGAIQVLARLFGGQGTINVPSWSPDGSQLAFVSYRLARR